ncbi:MAG: hypothetical protein RR585_14000 [Coprobacillus sp.]
MRIIKTDISKIKYNYQKYHQDLYDSVMRIGFSFPVHVQEVDNQYICIDGHKRLSVLHDILENNPDYSRGGQVCILIKNTNNARSHDCWNGRNTH